MKIRTAILIDGGHLRVCAKLCGQHYNVDFIESFSQTCSHDDDYLFRVFYYDAPQYRGEQNRPVSGKPQKFQGSDKWMTDLAKRERFAVRRGTLAFRGWGLKSIPLPNRTLQDDDFKPNFEQKGVDMRIGLDIATLSDGDIVDRIVLVSADTDLVPAMKHARKAGVEVVMVQLPKPAYELHDLLQSHADAVRRVSFKK